MSLVPSRRLVKRDVSYEFMNRQMVWHAFTVGNSICLTCTPHLTFLQGIPPILAPTHQRKNHSPPVLPPSFAFITYGLVPVLAFQTAFGVSGNHRLAAKKRKGLVSSRRPMRHLHGKRNVQHI